MEKVLTVRKSQDVKMLIRSVISEERLTEIERLIETSADYTVEFSEYGVLLSFKAQ